MGGDIKIKSAVDDIMHDLPITQIRCREIIMYNDQFIPFFMASNKEEATFLPF